MVFLVTRLEGFIELMDGHILMELVGNCSFQELENTEEGGLEIVR